MFRDLQKKEKALSEERSIEILTSAKRGILSVIGDFGYPYGAPMNHYYDKESGKLYFHCGHGGHREDSLKKCNKASFTAYIETKPENGWAYDVESVIVFGDVEIIDDSALSEKIVRALCKKFTDDTAFVDGEVEKYLSETLLLVMTPLHITGKKIKEQ